MLNSVVPTMVGVQTDIEYSTLDKLEDMLTELRNIDNWFLLITVTYPSFYHCILVHVWMLVCVHVYVVG